MRKKKLIVLLSIFAVIVIAITVGCVWVEVTNNPKYYTYEEHFERVSEIAKTKITSQDFEIQPLYTEKDEVFGFVILGENKKGSYIRIANPLFLQKLLGCNMYRDSFNFEYTRYKIRPGETSLFENGIEWTKTKDESLNSRYPDRLWETTEDMDISPSYISPYALEGIQNDKKYLLQTTVDGEKKYIPAVKRGDKYLNLISLDEFEYKKEFDAEEIAVWDICFNFVAELNFE